MPESTGPLIGFIMSTEVGWKTQYLNYRRSVEQEPGIQPRWIVISWWHNDGFIERIPLLPSGIKARIRSRLQLSEGLKQGPFDALFVGVGHVLHGGKSFLSKQPYFISTDVTPVQLHAFGSHYGITGSRFPFIEARKQRGWGERYRAAAALLPCSKWVADSMIGDYGADPKRVHVIQPGVDTNAWEYIDRSHNGETVNILFVGGHFVRKGGDRLLRWASQTKQTNWKLNVVTREKVECNDPRVTIYHGLDPNDDALHQLYRQAHLFALPTRADCHSLASLEALSTGLPVILSLTGGTGDIIKNGETGYLIDTDSDEQLFRRLDELVQDGELRKAMGKAARKDAVERFDSRTNVRATLQIIKTEINK